MSDDRPPRESMSIEEATISNMWEIAAILEVLERKGLCTKQGLYDIITESRRLLPVKTRSMWTTVLSDDGDRARRLSCQLHSARVSAVRNVPALSPRDFVAHFRKGRVVGVHKGLPAATP
jgi:hypothetical protein